MQQYLEETAYFDYQDPSIKALVEKATAGINEPMLQAIALYYAVRDQIRYNPYVFSEDQQTFSASYCLKSGESYCIPKAVLLGACCRSLGIPARLGFADVKNHLSSPQLIEFLRSDEFVMHGYVELFLEDKWVKATPAFNQELCTMMGVAPLEFNGRDDSIFHEFNGEGERHMEYLRDHGTFADLPYDLILKSMRQAYPHLSDKATIVANDELSRSLQSDMDQITG